MLKILRELLVQKINDIDAGNSNIDEDSAISILNAIQEATDTNKMYTRTEAAKYLQCSIQTFDGYRSSGKLPKGVKKAGRLEEWSKKQLDDFVRREKYGH